MRQVTETNETSATVLADPAPQRVASNRSHADATSHVRSQWVWWSAAFIALCARLAYSDSLTGEFLFDDRVDIIDNFTQRPPRPLWRVLATRDVSGLHVHSRPVVVLSFAVNYLCGGFTTWNYHVTNLVIHILAGLVLLGIVRRTLLLPGMERYAGASLPLAWLIALVWTLHPLETQAVSYIVQRYESLMGLFYVWALYCAIRALTGSRIRRWGALSFIASLLAMGSKEPAITIPLIVLLYDRAFVAGSFRESWRRHGGLHAALAIAGLLYIPFYWACSGTGQQRWAGFGIDTPWYAYAATQPAVILHYLRLCFWPSGQCLEYGWPIARTAGEIVPGALVIGGLLAVTAWACWRRPRWGFLGAWFFLILAPTSSLMPIADVAYEHRMYLPSAAVCAVTVLALYELMRPRLAARVWTWPAAALYLLPVAAVVLALGACTFLRNRVYASELAIWEDCVRKCPGNAGPCQSRYHADGPP